MLGRGPLLHAGAPFIIYEPLFQAKLEEEERRVCSAEARTRVLENVNTHKEETLIVLKKSFLLASVALGGGGKNYLSAELIKSLHDGRSSRPSRTATLP